MSNIINLSEPPLPNGVLIGGVANFYTATKPIARVDGSALVIGDKWENPSTGVDGFWNGTLWLTAKETIMLRPGLFITFSATNTGYSLGVLNSPVSKPNDLIFVNKMIYSFYSGVIYTADNRWEIFDRGFEYSNRGGSTSFSNLVPSAQTTTVINNQARVFAHEQEYNALIPTLSGATETSISEIRLSITKFGTAQSIFLLGILMEYSRAL